MQSDLAATTTVFPSDEAGKVFLKSQGRGDAGGKSTPTKMRNTTNRKKINLSELEPLVALPMRFENAVSRARSGRQRHLSFPHRVICQSRAARLCHCRLRRGRQTVN